ncbi:PITH domain-containing protein [Iris pallida]|uniref:PITH domain-containing protein n=1 Tax=Iris pallida TaxID=29817 RepID=A0AAX6GHT4_IRIPA|nr:PITH domain-containing protein [Iris pallida]
MNNIISQIFPLLIKKIQVAIVLMHENSVFCTTPSLLLVEKSVPGVTESRDSDPIVY